MYGALVGRVSVVTRWHQVAINVVHDSTQLTVHQKTKLHNVFYYIQSMLLLTDN